MNAVFKPVEAEFEPLSEARLEAVVAIEEQAYEHPWTRGNFMDSVRAGYQAQLLVAGPQLLGYFVAMKGVDEVHLLNLTVAPEMQGQGWGRVMLDALAQWSRGQGAQWLWLEVRASNQRAQLVYTRHGYRKVGERRGYYPNGLAKREDAVVMSLKL
jgi:ribosomal-protein-alanine N-acetyltransferase